MQPHNQSNEVAQGKTSHTLYLTGIYRGGYDVLLQAKMALDEASADRTMAMQLTIRSIYKYVVQALAAAIAHIDK